MRKRTQGGNSIVEVALLSPWIFFLFVGVFDFGFYSYAGSCAENAARIAALQVASTQGLPTPQMQALACSAVILEMARVPNKNSFPAGCGSAPLIVTQQVLRSTTPLKCADCLIDPNAISILVTVTYQSNLFIPIPGVLTNQLSLTRTSEVRMISPP